MNKENDLTQIIETAILQSYSYGAAPYSISLASLTEQISAMIQNCSESYSNIIFISLWKDYNKIDLEEYLKLSKEYLSIDTQENKKGFIQYRMDELLPEKNFKIWKDNNTSYALGLILNGIRNFGGKFQVVDIDKIHPEFKNELAVLQNPLLQQQYAIFI